MLREDLNQRLSFAFLCWALLCCVALLSLLGYQILSPEEAGSCTLWRHGAAIVSAQTDKQPGVCGAPLAGPACCGMRGCCILSSMVPGSRTEGSVILWSRKTGNSAGGRNLFHLVFHVPGGVGLGLIASRCWRLQLEQPHMGQPLSSFIHKVWDWVLQGLPSPPAYLFPSPLGSGHQGMG